MIIMSDYLQRLTDIELLALLVAAESDNQPLVGRVAVACVPIERLRRKRWGNNLCKIILAPYQFSCFNDDDHWQRFTQRIGSHVQLAELAIEHLLNSPASGATHYHCFGLNPLPKWALPKYSVQLGRIGDHVFYMEK